MSKGRWKSGVSMLEEVHAIGVYLIHKKGELGHGKFRQWVEGPDGPPCSYRTARLYMQLCREMNRSGLALAMGADVPPPPSSLRQLVAETQTPRGRLRAAIGVAPAIALPPPRDTR